MLPWPLNEKYHLTAQTITAVSFLEYSYCGYRYGEIFTFSLNMVNSGRRRTKTTELGTELGPFYPEPVFFLEKRKK